MRFAPTRLSGVRLIDLEPRQDERGTFVRTYCEEEFMRHGLNTRWPQCNQTVTDRRGTIRGLHFQEAPAEEIKLVRCTAGEIFDVLVDLRPRSPSYGQHEAFSLTAERPQVVYVPGGIAHGFQTLVDHCRVEYMMSVSHDPSRGRGARWNDPRLGIAWPLPVTRVSEQDQQWPLLPPLPPMGARP